MKQEVRIVVVVGTRPEAIKMAPVIRVLRREPAWQVRVVATGQHRKLLDQALAVFDIVPDYDVQVMTAGQTLPELTARLLSLLDPVIAAEAPNAVLVQGDTTTAWAAALLAFYRRIPVGHVEAGLRTNDRYAPFPEEINRQLVGVLASWHFAPTERARTALLREGKQKGDIVVTGNTVIDALHHIVATTQAPPLHVLEAERRVILVTAHRRESFGIPFEALCRAIRRVADAHPQVDICFPVHLNPRVQEPVWRILSGHPRIHLLEPLDYVAFVHLMARADIVLTDSGGIQEEAPALGKPVLVMREATERPEAVDAGVAKLVGTDGDRIVESVTKLLVDEDAYRAMTRTTNLFGDGRASERIVDFLRERLIEP